MKTVSILFLLSLMIFSSCENGSESENVIYDSMHFIRQGGGQIDFNLSSTDSVDQVKVIVSKYNFRDTTILIIIKRNSENELFFSSFHDAIKDKLLINGNFQQPTLDTGTWAYIYFVSKGVETEVTNIGLREKLLKVEQLVRDKIEANTIFDKEISINEQFQIELISNPTTGYSWTWVNKQTVNIVDIVNSSYIANTPVLVGSGGKEIWKFIGAKSGIDTIKMEYSKSWDPNSTIDSKTIVVKVK